MSATFEQDCAALWIKEQIARFGADTVGAIEWMETAKAQEMYIEHNGAKNIRSSAKSAIEALEMAIKAYKEAVEHAAFFGSPNDWESIRIRLMVHYANLKSGFMGSIEKPETAKQEQPEIVKEMAQDFNASALTEIADAASMRFRMLRQSAEMLGYDNGGKELCLAAEKFGALAAACRTIVELAK